METARYTAKQILLPAKDLGACLVHSNASVSANWIAHYYGVCDDSWVFWSSTLCVDIPRDDVHYMPPLRTMVSFEFSRGIVSCAPLGDLRPLQFKYSGSSARRRYKRLGAVIT